MSKKKPFIPPFRVGDVVKYVGSPARPWTVGEKHIIHKAVLDEYGVFDYATNRGAWFKHVELELVRECDAKSIQQLRKEINDEYGGE